MNITRLLVNDLKVSKYEIAKNCKVSWNTVSMWYKEVFLPNKENNVKLEKMYEYKKK